MRIQKTIFAWSVCADVTFSIIFGIKHSNLVVIKFQAAKMTVAAWAKLEIYTNTVTEVGD